MKYFKLNKNITYQNLYNAITPVHGGKFIVFNVYIRIDFKSAI